MSYFATRWHFILRGIARRLDGDGQFEKLSNSHDNRSDNDNNFFLRITRIDIQIVTKSKVLTWILTQIFDSSDGSVFIRMVPGNATTMPRWMGNEKWKHKRTEIENSLQYSTVLRVEWNGMKGLENGKTHSRTTLNVGAFRSHFNALRIENSLLLFFCVHCFMKWKIHYLHDKSFSPVAWSLTVKGRRWFFMKNLFSKVAKNCAS